MVDSDAEVSRERVSSLCRQLNVAKQALADLVASSSIPVNIQQRELLPGRGLDTNWSLILQHEYEFGGYAGLMRAAQKLITELQIDPIVPSKSSYDDIKNQAGYTSMMVTLATMNDRFLKAMLDGTLFYRIEEDVKFRRMVLGDHALRKSPGNYIQTFVRKDVKRSSNQSQIKEHGKFKSNAPYHGKSLTFRQLSELYETAKSYLPQDPYSDPVAAYKIDSIFITGVVGSLSKYQGTQRTCGVRKYCSGDTQERKLNKWLEVLKTTWIYRIEAIVTNDEDDPILDEPMVATPFEIGWGVDLQARANAHDEHRSSNHLFTFYQALVRYTCDPHGTEFHVPRHRTHLIFDAKDSFEEGKRGDVGMTLLAQSEFFQGGLNPVPGGGAGVGKRYVEEKKSWIEESQNLLFSNGDGVLFFENMKMDEQKLDRLKYLQSGYDATVRKATLKHEIQECLEECDELDQKMRILDQIIQVNSCESLIERFNKFKDEEEASGRAQGGS